MNQNEIKLYKVGDSFKPKRSRIEYIVVATFEDDGHQFFVAKKPMCGNSWSYGSIFTYNDEGEVYQRS